MTNQEYQGKQMIEKVFEIIRDTPIDDFWREKDNEFLFEDISTMCERAGYQLILKRKKE